MPPVRAVHSHRIASGTATEANTCLRYDSESQANTCRRRSLVRQRRGCINDVDSTLVSHVFGPIMKGFHISTAIEQLWKDHAKSTPVQKLHSFLLKDSWTLADRQTILNLIAQSLSIPELTNVIAEYFSPILLDLFCRISSKTTRLPLFCALSQLIGHYACATNFAYERFGSGFFDANELCNEIGSNEKLLQQFLESCFVFLNFDSTFFNTVLNWSFISKLISPNACPDNYCRWISVKIYELLLKIDCTTRKSDTYKFNEEELPKLRLACFNLSKTRVLKFSNKSIQYGPVDRGCILDCDFSPNVVSIYGILLQQTKPVAPSSSDLVALPSVEFNLQTAALGVSLGKPILVEGPMGSGKTTLIRQLARLTGRGKPPDVLTIQISDQVDSKYLLGSYICSDVPGEFLFNLGPLLRAIQSGSWLILEDIDFASSDVISLVTSIVESKNAAGIPGCENKIEKYDSNFRIFFTRRLTGSNSEVGNLNLMNLLGRVCTVVTIENLDLAETSQLILEKWPALAPLVPKPIVEIYQNLTSSDRTSAKRFITLRDLLKWCHRLSNYIQLNSGTVSDNGRLYAFLDAIDCFASFSPNLELFENKCLTLSTSLNISKAECNQLLTQRTPDIKRDEEGILIGRQTIARHSSSDTVVANFAFTKQSLQLLERLAVCVYNGEAVLLCGETGVGKTSCIQYLASLSGKSLTVINMNQQSDSVELFGGYKPIDIKFLVNNAREEYQSLFASTFNADKNATFLAKFIQVYNKRDWKTLLEIMTTVCKAGLKKSANNEQLCCRWKILRESLQQIQDHLNSKSELTFAFMEGALTRAVKEGHWVLLDEINLAEFETLQSLLTMLDKDGSFLLFEKAKDQAVQVHPDFRLFACMNPATDVGKRELPIGIQNRFTEFYISEISDKAELRKLVAAYIGVVGPKMVEAIVDFYAQVKHDAANLLKDINGFRPVYSLRNLCRALRISSTDPFYNMNRSIYESFCLAFLSNLDADSGRHVQKLIEKVIFTNAKLVNLLKSSVELPHPLCLKYVKVDDCPYPIVKGTNETHLDETYIRTDTVKKNLQDISRIIFAGKTLPILLQGETSVGKTSLITWLAKATGNVCYRVNNHEHTDLQEYIGSYSSDENGKIVFKEGVLVEAMRNGYWLILDELNLAPTEVLEALNRVLDDNRELFIPETQDVIKADPRFLLFATQNPPGRYGGRKVLSRAFRNRFIELHFSEIPSDELKTILHRKCLLPNSYSNRMVEVLLELQRCRSKSDIFAGKHGLITLRDLFRWGYRYMKFSREMDRTFFDWDQYLANQGFMLLAGRVRKAEEMTLIKEILQKKFRREISIEKLFYDENTFEALPEFGSIVWTKAFKRLGTLIEEAIKYEEPVLLVGETGSGKTTICQYFAARRDTNLRIVNCHMNTESADFLGSLRPNRNLSDGDSESLFEWVDGPLIRAMKNGSYLLVDEISLADDSVLERLNSVLEFERTIFLAESSNSLLIQAQPAFRYFATMNPGGDYGKKELSPALRDRFTEIWCPIYEDETDIQQIIEHNLALTQSTLKCSVSTGMCQFISWFQSAILNSKHFTYSIRDILTWVNFINQSCISRQCLSLRDAFTNGAFLVLVDSLGTCNTLTRNFHGSLHSARQSCSEYLQLLTAGLPDTCITSVLPVDSSTHFTVAPFDIRKGVFASNAKATAINYYWKSKGVQTNLFRIMRSLQLDKPILLEGPPGVGKTSLVQALASITGHSLIRINLSEQTDIADLFGCDLPMEGENSAGKFSFRDGPLLKALKSESTWILLDELNLASQTVLEGLNACLDHRGEIYIPELNRTFHINKSRNRIFASQNPFSMDGSRKGLPKSFLNRFTMVYIDHLVDEDFFFILSNLYSKLGDELINKMIQVNQRICRKVQEDAAFARKGGPFEFNLRDLIRWADVTLHSSQLFGANEPERFFDLIFTNKMRTQSDRDKIESICFDEFKYRKDQRQIAFYLHEKTVQCGHAIVQRLPGHKEQVLGFLLESQKQVLESVLKCIEMNWMGILIGASGFGKSFIVQMLANLCGQKLHILNVNSEMDTNDLLGGFEQKDFAVDLKDLEDCILALSYCLIQPSHANSSLTFKFLSLRAKLVRSNVKQNIDDFLSYKVQHLKSMLELFVPNEETDFLMSKLNYLEKIAANRQLVNGAFEWRDSQLIKCIETGQWLLIDNANQLNASVLDRLNSLLENDGTLVITEKGSVDGEMVSVHAHPNFRLFLTTNPHHGELSRAMRNRGIEIVLPESLDMQIESLFLKFGFDRPSHLPPDMDYSSMFRIIYETLLKSQHGLHSDLNVNPVAINSFGVHLEGSPPLCINSLIADPSTYYVLQDFVTLDMSDMRSSLNGTKLRLFLESASLHDYSLRMEVLSNMAHIPADRLTMHAREMTRMKQWLSGLFADRLKVIEHLPIDSRENVLLYQAMCWKSLLPVDSIDQLSKRLNLHHVSLYWIDLAQRLGASMSASSLMSLAVKIANGELNSKLYSQSIVPIHNAIQSIPSEAAALFLRESVSDQNVLSLRCDLLWTSRLAQCCYHQIPADWTQKHLEKFIQEHFFPLWFMFNEKIVPQFPAKNALTDAITQVNAFFQLHNCTFDAAKFQVLKQLTTNYFQFSSSEDIELFGKFLKLWELMKLKKAASIAELNSMSQQCACLLTGYYTENVPYSVVSSTMIQYCELLKEQSSKDNDDVSEVFHLNNEAHILVKSDMWLSSILYSKLLSHFASGQTQLKDVVGMVEENSFAINPLLLFASRTMQASRNHFNDICLYLLANMNEDFTVKRVVEYFYNKQQDHSYDSSIWTSQMGKSGNLTIELLPLLSLTCFNIYQVEQISTEGFFSKSFTLDFYMNFLVQNYITLKSSHSLFVDKLVSIADNLQQRLLQLDSTTALQMQLTDKSLFNEADKSEVNVEESKWFHLISIGFAIANCTSIDFPIDPVVRSHAILDNCRAETELLEEEVSLRLKLKQRKYCTSTTHFDSAVMCNLEERMAENHEVLANTSLPIRLNASQYVYLKSDLDQFCATVFNLNALQPLCVDLLNCLQNEETPKVNLDRVIRNSISCQRSLENSLKRIEESYRNYHDLTSPFLVGASLVLKGLQLATFSLQSRSNTRDVFASFEVTSMPVLLGTFFQFLNTHCPHEIGEFILQNGITKFADVASRLRIEEKPLVVSLLKSAFLEIENSIFLGFDTKYLFSLYLDIVDLFVQWWKQAKHEEEMEKLKNESVFYMKLADEPDDANLRTVFPSFESRFRDLMEDDKFADLSKNKLDDDEANTQEALELNMSKETLLFIIRSHMKLITLKRSCQQDASLDLQQPYLIRYQILSNIFKKTLGFVDLNIERELIDGHILVNNHLTNLKCRNDIEDRPINVYRESLVSQTRQCFEILEKLKRKIVAELLPQFENHPTLLKLLKVIDRVHKIEVNSSLLSFATGLEVILKSADDWQLIAHRGISLIDHLNEITELLVEWRKLEIKHWSFCLQGVLERAEESELVTWWFHFYLALQDLAQANNEQAVIDFVGSVSRLIEKSNLGQFGVRLRILHSFVHQLRHNEDDPMRHSSLLIALENLHRFYGHFSGQVANAIEAERMPIEKEIKEFVKISKWNPNNFWSLKASLDKSHRQLYGYMKKFELALNKPANLVFAFERLLKPNTWKMSIDLVYKSQSAGVSPLQLQYEGSDILAKHHSYVVRSDKLCRKSTRMCRVTLEAIDNCEDVNNELISGINEYSSLKVAPTTDLDKWKKAVGQIQSRKRRALSDLFTHLSKFGLSFRKGLVTSNELNVSQLIGSIYPLTGEAHFEEKASLNLTACNTYFYKCLSGLMKFIPAIKSDVNLQITPDMRDRMEGFTTELTRIVSQKRKTISNDLLRFTSLNSVLETMNRKCTHQNGENQIVNATEMRAHFDEAQLVLTKLISFAFRLQAVLQSLQKTNTPAAENIPLIETTTNNFSAIDIPRLESLIIQLRQLFGVFDHTHTLFYTTSDLDQLTSVATQLRRALDSMKGILQVDTNLVHVYAEQLNFFESRISDICHRVQKCKDEYPKRETLLESLSSKRCNAIIKKVLLSVQNTYSLLEKLKAIPKNEEDSSEDATDLIVQKVLCQLLEHLNSSTIAIMIERFFAGINSDSSEGATGNYQLVCALLPFLRQYMSLYRTILSISFGSLKTVSKMLHIILSLFNELATNGFCLPPEPNDKKENTQLKDIQNSGFGSGDTSGAQDVSERLNCQDQLDELAKKEQEDDANDESNEGEKDEEKGVEMDEDFDGKENGPEQKEVQESDEEEENVKSDDEDQFDDKMGDVEDDEDMLDEKLWGDESEEEDNTDDLNESEQTGGKDNIESEVVGNENNQDSKKNEDENADSEDENKEHSEQINENEMEDEYQNEAPDKYKDSGADEMPEAKDDAKMELPEDINLDDESPDGEEDSGEDAASEKMDTEENDAKEEEEEVVEDGIPQMDDIEMLDEGEDVQSKEEEETDDQNAQTNLDVNTEDKESEAQLDDSTPNLNYSDPNVANFDQHNSASAAPPEEKEPSKEQAQKSASIEPNSGQNKDKVSQSTSQQEDAEKEESCEEQSISKNNKSSRSLAEDARKAKRQKIMHSRENEATKQEAEAKPSDTYRHVDEAEKASEVAYDMAIPEDAEQQQVDDAQRGVEFAEEPEMEETDQPAEPQMDKSLAKPLKETGTAEAEEQTEGMLTVEGEIIPTMTVARPDQSSFHTSDPRNLLSSQVSELELKDRVPLQDKAEVDMSCVDSWKECEQKIEPLVYELCNQLQLVLEPTKCAKFKGDFKSGKRLNMRKVIAYVASDFRKDKIWLRRSKPSKRQYQILIAVDDSLSMADNRSKQMAFESLILLGKSLSIIESGALSVLSFGEQVRVLHSFTEPFTDQSAFKMFSKFQFDQQQTRIAEMLQCSLSLFDSCRSNGGGASRSANSSNIYQLLLIVSDGRGINSGGNEHLHRAILKLKEMSIFSVFLIIDNPEHNSSILDIQLPVFEPSGKVIMKSYIEKFPFPYYVILKDINSLPSILGEALRQWFEMITHESQ